MLGDCGIVEVLCAVGVIFAGIWYYLTANYNFWKQRGVPGPEPKLLFGNAKELGLPGFSLLECISIICEQFPGAPLVGLYQFRDPWLLVRDPELIRDVMIKDFTSFSERQTPLHEHVEPLNAHLFNLETKRWRALRPKLSPAFTSGKMKQMFSLMLECGEYFEKYMDTLVERGELIDCREIAAKFTTDVIGSCAFGLHMNSLADGDSEFRKMGKKFFDYDFKTKLLIKIRAITPGLYDLLGIPVTSPKIVEFFTASLKKTMDYRKKDNTPRGDLVDILMDLQYGPQTSDIEMTESLITAQAFVFFVAGFETSATTISHALMELAQHQDIQERLRQEIIESLERNNGKITYDSVKEMKYLHMVFEETLRLRPPVGVHFRKSVSDYTFRGTNVTIPKGSKLWIPVYDIHLNPEYYPNPTVFDPERFTEEMCKARHPMTYTPFGDGPRNCIGARFAIYQTKLPLIKILAKYKVDISEKLQLPYKHNPASFLLQPAGGIHLKITKLE